MSQKFTIRQFHDAYPDDDACLAALFQARYGSVTVCPGCKKETSFYRVSTRKVYGCQWCGYQLSPTADTIFHKSPTPLKDWFYAIYLFAASRNGVSAKELERQLGVTYKTAWRMARQIRLLCMVSSDILSGIVEADETYVGGKKKRAGKHGKTLDNKTAVVGQVERHGEVRAQVTRDTTKMTVMPLVRQNVAIGARLMTDEYHSYKGADQLGYTHETVKHYQEEWARDDVHTNTIEGFWSQLKRSIDGTYHAVSPKYLQRYVNEFVYRYNARTGAVHLFDLMLAGVVRRAG
jgi:transposase